MGITYTRSEIRTLINMKLRDSNNTKWTAAQKNYIIAEVHRDFVERTECNRNVLIFSLASASANGAVEYDRNGTTPTITRIDVENQNHYKISDCDRIDYLGRWVGQAANYDGYSMELQRMDQTMIDDGGFLGITLDPPVGYQMLSAPDTFRFIPVLDSSGYTYKFEVRYRAAVVDLITTMSDPVAAADDTKVPNIPLRYRNTFELGIVAELFELLGDDKAQIYRARYETGIQRITGKVNKDASDREPRIRMSYRGMGG